MTSYPARYLIGQYKKYRGLDGQQLAAYLDIKIKYCCWYDSTHAEAHEEHYKDRRQSTIYLPILKSHWKWKDFLLFHECAHILIWNQFPNQWMTFINLECLCDAFGLLCTVAIDQVRIADSLLFIFNNPPALEDQNQRAAWIKGIINELPDRKQNKLRCITNALSFYFPS